MLAAEAAPWIKVGGLADVAGELPRALKGLGVEVRLALPLHPALDAIGLRLRSGASVVIDSRLGPQRAEVVLSEADGLLLFLLDGEPIRAAASVYSEPGPDSLKYTFFSLAALLACEALDWCPDVAHAHDWHAAPAVARLAVARARSAFWRGTATVLTVHNLPFMGAGGEAALDNFGIEPSTDPNLPDWSRQVPLALGMAGADFLTAVSPTYAQEIQTPESGCGLETFLRTRSERLVGILNGLDRARWDPAADTNLTARFTADTLEARAQNKHSLQADLGLPVSDEVPLLAMITRMDPQKGIDLALGALRSLGHEPWQFVLLGTGDPRLEDEARTFADEHSARARAIVRFDPSLSRRIYGGADMLLVPSRYEPCGLTQMIAMRYGCIPVVRATGGLKDTVDDSTGFVFDRPDAASLAEAIQRALRSYERPAEWRTLQRHAMAADFGWERSARQYIGVYQQARAERPA